jgi:putative transposase
MKTAFESGDMRQIQIYRPYREQSEHNGGYGTESARARESCLVRRRSSKSQIGVSEVTFYRWRQEFGGLKADQVKRLKDLELENSRLRKAISDLTLDKLILTEAAKGNF